MADFHLDVSLPGVEVICGAVRGGAIELDVAGLGGTEGGDYGPRDTLRRELAQGPTVASDLIRSFELPEEQGTQLRGRFVFEGIENWAKTDDCVDDAPVLDRLETFGTLVTEITVIVASVIVVKPTAFAL